MDADPIRQHGVDTTRRAWRIHDESAAAPTLATPDRIHVKLTDSPTLREVERILREHGVGMLTVGRPLPPRHGNLVVRSSYHAGRQAHEARASDGGPGHD